MSEDFEMTFEKLTQAMLDRKRHASKLPNISVEGKIARLHEYAERAGKPCPFAVGDIVTPRRGGIFRDVLCGEPCLVIEVLDPPHVTQNGEIGSFEELRRIDIRLAEYQPQNDSVVEKVGASWEFQRWVWERKD